MSDAWNENKSLLALVLCLLALLYVGITNRDIYTRGEGREALVSQNMFLSCNYILPESYSNWVPSKPPLLHWMINASSGLTGKVTEVTARIPSAVFFFTAVIIYYYFLKYRYDANLALCSSVILSTSLEWYRSGVECRVDMVFSASLFIALLALFNWNENGMRNVPYISVLFLLAATICKGPAALIISGIIFSVYLFSEGVSFFRIIKLNAFLLIPVFILSLIWYLAAYHTAGDAFLNKIYHENIARFLSTMEDEPHNHGVLYLLGTIPVSMLPWTLVLIPALISTFRNIVKINSWNFFSDKFNKFSLVVILSVTLFYCFPSSKRSVYLLPIYPFIAYYAALLFRHFEADFPVLIKKAGRFCLLATISLFLFFLIVYIDYDFLVRFEIFSKPRYLFYLQEIHSALNALNTVDIFLLSMLAVYSVYFIVRPEFTILNIAFLFFLLFSSMQYVFITHYANTLSPKNFAAKINSIIPENVQIYTNNNNMYALSFYTKRKFLELEGHTPETGSMAVIFKNDINLFQSKLGYMPEIVLESDNYIEKPLKKLIVVKLGRQN